jgi:hypothetical protein
MPSSAQRPGLVGPALLGLWALAQVSVQRTDANLGYPAIVLSDLLSIVIAARRKVGQVTYWKAIWA